MNDVNISQATILAGVLIANIGGILGFFVSIIVKLTELRGKVDRLEKDVNEGWKKIKTNKE